MMLKRQMTGWKMTKEEKIVLKTLDDQNNLKGHFRRIFPAGNYSHYKKFFPFERPLNEFLDFKIC